MSSLIHYTTIKEDDMLEFSQIKASEQNKRNAYRGFYLMLAGIVIEALLILFNDIPTLITEGSQYEHIVLYLSFHVILFSLSVFSVYYTKRMKDADSPSKRDHQYFARASLIVPLLYLSIVAAINGLDQQHVESISLYTTFSLLIGTFVIISPKKSALMFGLSHLVFILSIVVFQDSRDIALINIINASIIVLSSYIVSILSYMYFTKSTIGYFLLVKAKEEYEVLSNTDYLTNTYNRRFGMKRLQEELSLSNRTKGSFSLLMLDVDDFKSTNDLYGHIVGDETLVELVNLMKGSLREEDTIIRYGGEEFLILLPNTNKEASVIVANKLIKTVSTYQFRVNEHSFKTSISIGAVSYPDDGAMTVLALLEEADRLLYKSKHDGKNRVSSY